MLYPNLLHFLDPTEIYRIALLDEFSCQKIVGKIPLHSLHRPRLHRKTFSASTCPRNVGIVEDKLCGELRLLEVHFCTKESQLRLLVDEDLDAVLRYLLVHLVPLKSVV